MKTTVINKYILVYNSIYSTRFYVVMWQQILYFRQNLLIPLFFKALHGRLKSQRDGTGGKLTVDPPFPFRRERGTGKI